MKRLIKLFTTFIFTISLISSNVLIFAETIDQFKDLKDSEKFDPDSSNLRDRAEIVPPEILDENSDNAIVINPPETGDKNKITPDDKIDPRIVKNPLDKPVK